MFAAFLVLMVAIIRAYWSLADTLGEIPGYLGALLLAVLVLLRKTSCPRWTIIANPALLIAAVSLATLAPAPFGAILVGGGINLSIAVFFLVSTLTTWRRVPEKASLQAVYAGQMNSM